MANMPQGGGHRPHSAPPVVTANHLMNGGEGPAGTAAGELCQPSPASHFI